MQFVNKKFFWIISDSVFQNHSRELVMLFLCLSLCHIICTVTVRFTAKKEGSRYRTFLYMIAMSQNWFLAEKCEVFHVIGMNAPVNTVQQRWWRATNDLYFCFLVTYWVIYIRYCLLAVPDLHDTQSCYSAQDWFAITYLESPGLNLSVWESHGYGNNEEGVDQEVRLWNARDEILHRKGVL